MVGEAKVGHFVLILLKDFELWRIPWRIWCQLELSGRHLDMVSSGVIWSVLWCHLEDMVIWRTSGGHLEDMGWGSNKMEYGG